jgi:hypothetical protein
VAELKTNPDGSVPVSLSAGVGEPVAVTVKEPATPTVKVVSFALLNSGATAAGFTVSFAETDVLLNVPVMVATVVALTELVCTMKDAVDSPAVTVTLVLTIAAALLLDSTTMAPPAGAAAVNVTVPVEEVPLVTLAGLNLRLLI